MEQRFHSRSRSCLCLGSCAFDFVSPSAATEPTDKTPKGRRAGTRVVFRRDMDVSSKNPGGGVDPECRRHGGRGGRGVLSLGYFSLHEQREVTRSCEAGAKALLSSFRLSLCLWIAWVTDLGYRFGVDAQVFRFLRTGEDTARAEAGSRAFAPLRGASHLSLLVQRKVAQRNTPLPPRPRHCVPRVHSASGIFRRDIHISSKNDARPCASPFGFFPLAPSLRKGARKVKSKGNSYSRSQA